MLSFDCLAVVLHLQWSLDAQLQLANLHCDWLLISDRWMADTLYWSEEARELPAYVETIKDSAML